MSAPVEVPEDIVERVRTLCLALPEVTVRVDGSLTRARSTAQSFDIRRRSFCLLVATEDSTGKPVSQLVLRADPDEREALLSIGHPFFASRAGRDRIRVLLTDDTDWEEIRELVTESYRILAPKKLTALLDYRLARAGRRARSDRGHVDGAEPERATLTMLRARWWAAQTSSGNSPRGSRQRIGSTSSAVPKCPSQLRHYDNVPGALTGSSQSDRNHGSERGQWSSTCPRSLAHNARRRSWRRIPMAPAGGTQNARAERQCSRSTTALGRRVSARLSKASSRCRWPSRPAVGSTCSRPGLNIYAPQSRAENAHTAADRCFLDR